MINNNPVKMILSYQTGDYLIGNSKTKYGLPWGNELEQDKEFFWSKIDNTTLVVLGRKTYYLIKDILLTKYGKDFIDYNTFIVYDFSSIEDIKAYLNVYKTFNKVLIIGGKKTYERFLYSGVVDTIYLTEITPRKFKYKGDCYLKESFIEDIINNYNKISKDSDNSYVYQLNYPKLRTTTPYTVRFVIREYERKT